MGIASGTLSVACGYYGFTLTGDLVEVDYHLENISSRMVVICAELSDEFESLGFIGDINWME
jgi:hypothetical protein